MAHGDTLAIPVEVQEVLFPLRVERWQVRQDSAGAGEWRGGTGLDKVVTPLVPCHVHVFNERTGCPPWGILGGHDGAAPRVAVERPGQAPEEARKANVPVGPGDRVHVLTSGGGGYGDPLMRNADRVATDVRLGYISREAAWRDYGVAIDPDGSVLDRETKIERVQRTR